MTTKITFAATAFLALTLLLAACSAESEPAPTANPATKPAAAPNSTRPPATSTQPPATSTQPPTPSLILPDLGLAPDITNEVWLNTERPLNLASLEGDVVLVEFWTFG